MFDELREINRRPKPFECYTAADLWTDEHTSKKMLEYHLNGSVDISSRNTAFINRSVDWIVKHFDLDSDSAVIDFGCGPGLYTTRFARKGITTTGIDFSARSIDHAKRTAADEGLDIEYIQSNYLDYVPSKKYDLAVMIMCDFCALGPAQRKIMLGKFRDALLPGGSVLLDVYSLNTYHARKETWTCEFNQLSHFWSAEDYYAFQNTFKYDDEKVLLDKYTIIEKSGKRVVYNWLQCFSAGSLKNEFEDNGLKTMKLFSDVCGSDYREDSAEMAIVARR
ncbi:MAG TPA: methyltransferase domain-containing protein [Spirochaetota bacterium]|nr:methyltransferase domain-containing protein [Spirochaetota bacterium]HPI90868.1 methyltransferase domain-containing protein [Spirochaetota bacterium]HPR48036.1 methyltransferase domain-containing protein [Spirochaetota bacterium]